nr:alpha-galactosidase [uncultured Friedmanniella sp.]
MTSPTDQPQSWTLPTATGVYVVGYSGAEGGPVLQHWGPAPAGRWTPADDHGFETLPDRLPSELTALGTRHVRGADLVVDHGDGLVGVRLIWSPDVEVTVDGAVHRLRAQATDTTGHLDLTLVVQTSAEHDVVRKHAVVRNTGGVPLVLDRAFGPAWELPVGPGAAVDLLAGHWGREFGRFRVPLPVGELSIGSRQGVTSHTYSPVLGISALDEAAAEAATLAYGVALAWPGSWRMLVDAVPHRQRVRVAGGVDDESGRIRLDPGEEFRTPDTVGVAAPDGPDGLRRRWHDHQRQQLARDLSPAHRPILYNSWYATTFDVRPQHQLELARRAAELGVEAFVVDDGWFADRNDDRHGLGNWWPDPVAFPAGLDPLISGVTELGLRFGIWVEPEAVNPGAAVLKEHPDWIYRAGDRPLVTSRHQYVLDLGRAEVRAWTTDWLRRLLADERITYLKWDMNRPISDGGRPGDPHGRAWSVQHARGYLEIMRMLRTDFPHVTVEACSGGGGRVDLAVLQVSDVVWPSDETGPRDRLAIQYGFLSAYGPHVMSSWVTDEQDRLDVEPASLEFRFLVAMAGVLGIGADLTRWLPAELVRGRELIDLYRTIRRTVHHGQVEVHGHPRDPVHVVEYGTPEQVVLLVYARADRPDEVVVEPRTLQPEQVYRLMGADLQASGAELAAGVPVPFGLAADADVLVLEPVP